MDDMQHAIAEARMDDTRQVMERRSKMTREIGEAVPRVRERNTQEPGQANSDAEDLKKELREIADAQKKLRSEVQALQQQDTAGSEQMKDLWAELAAKAAEHQRDAAAYAKGLQDADRPFYEQERALD